MKICDYGCGNEANYFFKNGKGCCNNSPNKCPFKRQKDSQRKKGNFNGTPYWEIDGYKKQGYWKGKKLPDEVKNKISESLKNNGLPKGRGLTPEKELERRRKLSEIIKKRYEDGWLPKSGRTKKMKYQSKYEGEVLLDGSWELLVAKYFDENKIEWRRNKKRFQYYDNNKKRFYTPDFYLIKSDTYIEVKGYETDLDRLKWSQFPNKIEIWNKETLISKGIL